MIIINFNLNYQMYDLILLITTSLFSSLLLFTQWQNKNISLFQQWKHKYLIQFTTQEQENYRLHVFLENYIYVLQHNQKFQKGLETYQLEMNQFAIYSQQQFGAIYLSQLSKSGSIDTSLGITSECTGTLPTPPSPLPTQIDWTIIGAVTQIKNQKRCGSCWAFSTTGSVQGLYYIKNKNLISFSEQQLVDCSDDYGNKGCLGGQMYSSFFYIKDHGITTQQKYPYVGQKILGKCKYQPSMEAFTIQNCYNLKSLNYNELLRTVATRPVSVAIQANHISFQLYRKGVYSGNCGVKLDHGVLVVGYGVENSINYWKVKNSWGKSWGENGYILILREEKDGEGKCGIQLAPSIPL